jgi:hypothetical protein
MRMKYVCHSDDLSESRDDQVAANSLEDRQKKLNRRPLDEPAVVSKYPSVVLTKLFTLVLCKECAERRNSKNINIMEGTL